MSHVGEPLIVLRNREGVIKCLSAVCRHRAMFVVEGHRNARGFTCPYHHWSYSLDGKLMGAPAMERACNFSKEQIQLPEFKVETWLGFIFINFDLDAPPLAPRLETVTKALANYGVASAEGPMATESPKFQWNWKVMFENNNDGYHANRLHHGPIHDICPSSMAVFPDLPSNTAGYFRFNGTVHIDAGFNPTLKAVLPIFPALTEEERGRMLFANIPPSLTLFARSDMISYNIFHAHGPDETSVHRGWLVALGAMSQPLFKERLDLNTAASSAAGYRRGMARKLMAMGADVRARNRRGAEPLHYAADGSPGSRTWNSARASGDDRLPHRRGRRPQRHRQERGDTATPRGAHPLRCRREGAARRGR